MLELDWNAKAKENQTIREHTDALLKEAKRLYNLGYISYDLYSILCIACEWHDTGKSNFKFQDRIHNHTKFDSEKELVHQFCSALLYIRYNCYKEKPQNLTYENKLVLFLILHHHTYDWDRMQDDMNCESAASKLLNENFGITDVFFRKNFAKVLKEVYVKYSKEITLLKGALHTCDYSASANLPCEIKNDFLSNKLELWKKENNITYRNMQIFCLSHQNENVLLIASTGSGKTEAGLLWSGNNKTFFVLPLRAAMTAIYDRMRYNLFENKHFQDKVGILYADTKNKYANLDVAESYSLSNYVNETRNLSLPITISTIDQLWNIVYKQNNYDKILFTLSYSKVILDEIQMYDPQLLAILLAGMKQMHELGTKFAVMTATLSPFVKHLLYEKTGINFKENVYLSNEKRHSVKVYNKHLDVNDITDVYESKKHGKMLVFCNRTAKAVSLYDEVIKLQKEVGRLKNVKVNILHAKYIGREKESLLNEIMEDGRTDVECDCIWIVTNIAEVSLDLDFDFGLSELYDYSSILQRQGRINRKGLKLVKDNNFYIYTEIDDNVFISETNRFGTLDMDVYNLSKQSVMELNGLVSEEDKVSLLNTYFTFDNLKNTQYYRTFEEKFLELERVEREFDKSTKRVRDIRQITILPKIIYDENRTEIDDIVNNIENLSHLISNEIDTKLKGSYKKDLVIERQKLLSYCVSDYYERYASHMKAGKVYNKLANLVDVVDIKYSHTCGLGYGNDSGIDYTKPIIV